MRPSGSLTTLALALGIAAIQVASGQEKPSTSTISTLSGPGATFTVPASEISNEWTVIGYGDTRFTDPANSTVTDPKVRKWLVKQIADEHPDALLISGDVPYDGSVSNDYTVFKIETEVWRQQHLHVYPALGNHELRGGDEVGLKNWWTAFPELNKRRWYSVSFGSAWFLMLDSDTPLTPQSEQQKWVAAQLKSLPAAVRFVFVILHHPPMGDDWPESTHNVRPNELALRDFLSESAKTLRARITVVAGHVHNYERFEKDGVTYLVAGGGGAKPYPVVRSSNDKFVTTDPVNYHYVTFHYDGKAVHAVMHRVSDPAAATPSWQIKDSFDIEPVK